jgi:hypothetical protein
MAVVITTGVLPQHPVQQRLDGADRGQDHDQRHGADDGLRHGTRSAALAGHHEPDDADHDDHDDPRAEQERAADPETQQREGQYIHGGSLATGRSSAVQDYDRDQGRGAEYPFDHPPRPLVGLHRRTVRNDALRPPCLDSQGLGMCVALAPGAPITARCRCSGNADAASLLRCTSVATGRESFVCRAMVSVAHKHLDHDLALSVNRARVPRP